MFHINHPGVIRIIKKRDNCTRIYQWRELHSISWLRL